MSTEMTEVHNAVGAYVSDALDAAERTDFEAHLAECELCRHEVAEFDETLAEFARIAAAAPPRSLRDRVLAGIAVVRPLPPPTVDDHPAEPAPIGAIRPSVLKRQRRGAPPDWEQPTDELAERRQWRRTRVLTAAVAATLVVALGLGGWVYSLVQQQSAVAHQGVASANAQRERELLTAPDAKVVSTRKDGAVYSFVFSRERNQALFLGTDLGDPGSGNAYQLWTVVGDAPPAPDALVAGYGRAQTWLDGPVRDAAAFAVSIEPTSGSTAPTQVQALVKA